MWPHGPRSRLCTLPSLSAHISATVSFCKLPKSGLEVHAYHVTGHTRRTCLAQQLGKPGHHVQRLSHCSKPEQRGVQRLRLFSMPHHKQDSYHLVTRSATQISLQCARRSFFPHLRDDVCSDLLLSSTVPREEVCLAII